MKKNIIFLLIIFFPFFFIPQTHPRFEDYFINKTMRIDYYHTGDNQVEFISLDGIYQQGVWAGNPKHLIDQYENGRYCIKVRDPKSGLLLFSKGFDSFFAEYKTTDPAAKGTKKTFHETALIPFPRTEILFIIEQRDRQNQLSPLFEQKIDPRSTSVNREALISGVKIFEILKNGPPQNKVDLAFVAEGYTVKQENKFKKDLDRLIQIFFQQEPYKTFKKRFNIYGVFLPSQQSGCDEPGRLIYKNTSLGTSFDSLGSERYLLTEANKSLRDIAAHVPYDALIIMINSNRYGGGGIFNFYCTCTVDNQWHPYLLLHEFGHSFAGLADEYYSSSIAYNEFYPKGIEPLEPNITALLDPLKLKWGDLMSKGIQIPTPWEKEGFDQMESEYQKIREKINKKINRMSHQGAKKTKLDSIKKESERLSLENAQKTDLFLHKSKFKDKVGIFLGAGYSSEGLYRPMVDCIMFTRGKKPYCKVCERTLIQIISHFSE